MQNSSGGGRRCGRYKVTSNKDCCTHQSPPESGRAELALFPAAADAKVGAMAMMGKLRSSEGVLSKPKKF